MDPRYISLSLSSTDENGRTNSFESTFDGASASAEALGEVFNSAAESIHELVYAAPIKSQGTVDPARREPLDFPEDHQSGLAAPNTALREFPAPEPAPNTKPELRTVPGSWLAPNYGVAHMTPGEVQRLLEQRDRHNDGLKLDKEKLIANLDIARQERDKARDEIAELDAKAMERLRLKDAELSRIRNDLRIAQEFRARADERSDGFGREGEHLRGAIEGLQADLQIRRRNIEDLEGQVAELRSLNGQQGTEIHRLQETNRELDLRLTNEVDRFDALARNEAGLKTRNDNQSKTIQSMQERLNVFEAGAPGVATLQLNYEALRIEASQAADDHTRLQDERDIARKERDQKTSELKDLQAVHEDLTEQFNDSQKKLKEDFGKALADAVDAAKARIMEEHPTNTWIMKITAGMHINEILKRVAPDA